MCNDSTLKYWHVRVHASAIACHSLTGLHIQSTGIDGTVYSSIFKDMYAYSGILMHIQPHSQVCYQGEEGRSPLPFQKSNVLILERETLIMLIFGLNFPFKMEMFDSVLNTSLCQLSCTVFNLYNDLTPCTVSHMFRILFYSA